MGYTSTTRLRYVESSELFSRTDTVINIDPGSSSVRRFNEGVSVGAILEGDPCLPATVYTTVLRQSGPIHIQARGLRSWLHKSWSKIRHAIKSINIKISISWDTLEKWLSKLESGWSIQTVFAGTPGYADVIVSAPPELKAEAMHWIAPTTAIAVAPPGKVLPGDNCGRRVSSGRFPIQCP